MKSAPSSGQSVSWIAGLEFGDEEEMERRYMWGLISGDLADEARMSRKVWKGRVV